MSMDMVAIDDKTLFSLVSDGDCSRLSDAQKLQFYKARCDSVGLDPRTQPFQFMTTNGRQTLYATKEASAQLSSKNGIKCEIVGKENIDGILVVTVKAKCSDGRETEDIGAVRVEGLKNDVLANAMMKCVTKAKRRAILSVCGLGMNDESELETIPNVKTGPLPTADEIDGTAKPEPEPVGNLSEAHIKKIQGWAKENNLDSDALREICVKVCGPHATSSDKLTQRDFSKLSKHFSKKED